MNAIVNFLLEHWPWVTITAVLIVLAVYVCVKASKWYFGRFVPTEKKANDADSKLGELHDLSQTVGSLPCSKHDESFTKIMEAITEIRTFLMTKNPKTAAMFAIKHSPLQLNEAGEKLLEDIGGKAFLDENKDLLIACIEEKTPKTALDVEECTTGWASAKGRCCSSIRTIPTWWRWPGKKHATSGGTASSIRA